jgi:hypothetical protein
LTRSGPPTEQDLSELENFVLGLYIELDKLAKKAPSAPLSDYWARRINRAISDSKALVGGQDKYAADLEPFVAAGDNPETQDGLLALREIRQAIDRVRQRLGYDESDFGF